MTRKDYIRAAEIVRACRSRIHESGLIDGRESFAADVLEAAFVRFFQDDNPRFDSARFAVACRLLEEG